MIIGHLGSIEEELPYYPEGIQKGIRFLMETDLAELSGGVHEIDGRRIFAKVSFYT